MSKKQSASEWSASEAGGTSDICSVSQTELYYNMLDPATAYHMLDLLELYLHTQDKENTLEFKL